MSIKIIVENQGWVLSHANFYKDVKVLTKEESESNSSTNLNQLSLDPQLFDIVEPYLHDKKSNKQIVHKFSEISSFIRDTFDEIIKIARLSNYFTEKDQFIQKAKPENNIISRRRANKFYEDVKDVNFEKFSNLHGSNETEHGVKVQIHSHDFLIPPFTKFFSGDIFTSLEKYLKSPTNRTFNLIVMDPPWKNKYVWRRKRKQAEAGYDLVDSLKIERLPIEKLCSENCYVVVWCTNAKAHYDDLVNRIFPKWGLEYFTTWYWVKITKFGEPICPFSGFGDGTKKEPYEQIVIGRKKTLKNVPKNEKSSKIVISVPSGIHSHKPPLVELLKKEFFELENYEESNFCELFARYLTPGFTSFGNEVLKLQHFSLYT